MLVMDAKSLCDSLNTQQANQADARSALEAGMIKEELDKLQALPRWIPHDHTPYPSVVSSATRHGYGTMATATLTKFRGTCEITVTSTM